MFTFINKLKIGFTMVIPCDYFYFKKKPCNISTQDNNKIHWDLKHWYEFLSSYFKKTLLCTQEKINNTKL